MIEKITDATGREWSFEYENSGRLVKTQSPEVELGGGTTARVTENFKYTIAADTEISISDLIKGGQISVVKGSDPKPTLTVGWSADGARVEKLTRGEGEDAIVTTIEKLTDSKFKIIEGESVTHPTVTIVEFAKSTAKSDDEWVHTTTVGEGGDALTSTTLLDIDGRVHESTGPGGIMTKTTYETQEGRLRFAPKTVTTTPGDVGEERPGTLVPLTTTYGYYSDSTFVETITRPGPTGDLTTIFELEGQNYPTKITAPDGTVTKRTYDDLGRVETVTSSTGSTTIMDYDDAIQHGTGGLIRTTTTASGTSTTRLNRNEQGFVTSSTTTGGDQPPRTTITGVNKLGWTLKTDTSTSSSQTTYDADGRIEQIQSGGTNSGGFYELSTTTPGYTSAGMINTITRIHGDVTEASGMTYDDAGRLWTSTTANLTTRYTYDTAGRTRTRTEGYAKALNPTTYDYDAAGRLEYTTTPGGKIWRNVYDKLGRQVGRIDPSGVREDLTMTSSGQLSSRQAKIGDDVWSWEEYGYDTKGRIHTHSVHRFALPPTGELSDDRVLTTTTNYYENSEAPEFGLVHTIVDPLGRTTIFNYDDAGRESLRKLPDGTEVETGYYPDGKVHERTVRFVDQDDPARSWELTTTTTYDAQGRVHTVTAPGGQVTTMLYDVLGRKATQTSTDSIPGENGEEVSIDRLTLWDYGDLGRVVTTTRPDGAKITREYDERGNLIVYSDTDGNATEYRYDAYGRLEKIYYPGDGDDSPSRTFTYEDDGEVDTITRKDGSLVDFTYEPNTGRLDTINVTGGVQPGGLIDFDYDGVGHLMGAFDNDVALGFTWDSLGNQLSESLSVPGIAGNFGTKEITRIFDDGNRPAILGLPDGTPYLQRLYDDGSRLNGLYVNQNQPLPGVPGSGQMMWSAEHAGSRITGITRGNGLATTYAYDVQGRPIGVTTGHTDSNGDINDAVHHLGFSWTEASLRRTKTRNDLNHMVEAFHYDEVGHLESNESGGIPAIGESDGDLAALTAMTPKTLEEWWTVNRVDELEKRNRTLEGREEAPIRDHSNPLHQVEQVGAKHYNWDVNGNLEMSEIELDGGGLITDATYTHDWRDRLVNVEQGSDNTRLIIDPLGRLVAKVKQTPGGEVNRIYLHDGDQVVAEYVQEAGGAGYQLDRRHHWGQWIDQLVAEEVDTDHDGVVDKTLYPLTDLLGSAQLLTDEQGKVVERIEYDADGTPHFFAADTTAPTVTRVAWSGNGTRPNGDSVTSGVFEIGFSEPIDEASFAMVTLTPDGGSATDLTMTMDAGARSAVISGAALVAGDNYTLHIAGLKDRWGNDLVSVDLGFAVADTALYSVLNDNVAPSILAVLDGSEGLYVVLDEPIMDGSVSVERNGSLVTGVSTRVSGQVVKWTPDVADWLIGGEYTISATDLTDFSGLGVGPIGVSFKHLAMGLDQVLVVYSEASESLPLGESAYGVTSLFQGRGWHSDLDLYYYRARWYSPGLLSFLERDPLGYGNSESLIQFNHSSPFNFVDPFGEEPSVPDLPGLVPGVADQPWLQNPHRPPGMYPAGPDGFSGQGTRSDGGIYSAHLTFGITAEFWAADTAGLFKGGKPPKPGEGGVHIGVNRNLSMSFGHPLCLFRLRFANSHC